MGGRKLKVELPVSEARGQKTGGGRGGGGGGGRAEEADAGGPPAKRRRAPGVRVCNGRIYDSENGRTCHQCRQKTIESMAQCNGTVIPNCKRNFCPKCLANRYGEQVSQAVEIKSWACPKCRGICNCSICMKKQGHTPTGILSHVARASGFESVAELLLKCSESSQVVKPSLINGIKGESSFTDENTIPETMVERGMQDAVKNLTCEKRRPSYSQTRKLCKKEPRSSLEAAAKLGPGAEEFDESKFSLKRAESNKSRKSKIVRMQHASVLQLLQVQQLEFSESCIGLENSCSLLNSAPASSDKGKTACVEPLAVDTLIPKSETQIHEPERTEQNPNSKRKRNPGKIVTFAINVDTKGIYSSNGKYRTAESRGDSGSKLSSVAVNKLASLSEKRKSSLKLPVMPKFEIQASGDGRNDQIENTEKKKKTGKLIVDINGDIQGIPFVKLKSRSPLHKTTITMKESEASPTKCKENINLNSALQTVDSSNNRERGKMDIHSIMLPMIDPIAKETGEETVCAQQNKSRKYKSMKKSCPMSLIEEEMVLPKGEQLATVSGVELSPDAVGQALQFVEFCSAFKEVLGLKKGDVESLLRECVRGCSLRRGSQSLLVQMHVKLLSILQDSSDMLAAISHSSSGMNSWLEVLNSHLREKSSRFPVSKLSSVTKPEKAESPICLSCDNDWTEIRSAVQGGAEGYDRLKLSQKLQIINCLCDDALETEMFRNYIDSAALRYQEIQRENREEVLSAKKRAKEATQKRKDAVVARMLAISNNISLSLDEQSALLSKVEMECERSALAKSAATEATLKMGKQRCYPIRTESIAVANDGRIMYKLDGAQDRDAIVLQDIMQRFLSQGNVQEAWFVYSKEDETALSKYLGLQRVKRHKRRAQSMETHDADQHTEDAAKVNSVL